MEPFSAHKHFPHYPASAIDARFQCASNAPTWSLQMFEGASGNGFECVAHPPHFGDRHLQRGFEGFFLLQSIRW